MKPNCWNCGSDGSHRRALEMIRDISSSFLKEDMEKWRMSEVRLYMTVIANITVKTIGDGEVYTEVGDTGKTQ